MSNRLPILQSQALTAHQECRFHRRIAAGRAIAAGEALNEAKALCAHGAWGDWLAGTTIPERTAQRYMKLHRAGCKPAIVADLGMAQAERVAALGLSLWPQDVCGVEVVGADLDGAIVYALVWPEGEGLARYWADYSFADPGLDFWVTRLCGLPVALGLLHESVAASDTHILHRMTPEETAQARHEVQA